MKMEKVLETSDYALAQKWAIEIAGDPNQAQMIIPKDGFIKAVRNLTSVSLTRKEDKVFGLGLGPNPVIDKSWERFSVERKADASNYINATPIVDLDIFFIDTNQYLGFPFAKRIEDVGEISDFLSTNAPESSVWPGNPEVLFWAGKRNEAGELIAIGALTMWESGQKVISSVGTAHEERGKGHATQLVAEMVATSHEMGFPRVGLAVRADNVAAKRSYEKVGFTLCGEFTIFTRN